MSFGGYFSMSCNTPPSFHTTARTDLVGTAHAVFYGGFHSFTFPYR